MLRRETRSYVRDDHSGMHAERFIHVRSEPVQLFLSRLLRL